MEVQSINIEKFRNIDKINFLPNSRINVIYGENGQGKTNILETIYLVGNLKSFRGGLNNDLVKEGTQSSSIKAVVGNNNVNHTIDLKINKDSKNLLFDGKNVKNYKDFFSCLRPVVFSPEEVLIVKGPHSLRRALLDRAIFQSSPEYLGKVRAYELCLRQRNKALQERLSLTEITAWTEALIKKGALLRQARFFYIRDIRALFCSTYRHISGNSEEVDIRYQAGGENLQDLEESLRQELARGLKRETFQCVTLTGPHRDEIDFILDNRSIRNYGSQGQQRSCILAFKTAQVKLLESSTSESPVLLLDDLNSELDKKRQNFYFEFLLQRTGQVFITTTDLKPFSARDMKNATFFQVVNGRIVPETE
jgi:DNA replication and repair protein RecF